MRLTVKNTRPRHSDVNPFLDGRGEILSGDKLLTKTYLYALAAVFIGGGGGVGGDRFHSPPTGSAPLPKHDICLRVVPIIGCSLKYSLISSILHLYLATFYISPPGDGFPSTNEFTAAVHYASTHHPSIGVYIAIKPTHK